MPRRAASPSCLEQLNTRDDSHPMKGHPGYQGDDIDYCAEIIRQAGSPHAKLLFDVYHVSIMNGDVIRRLRQYRDLLGHIHVAGNPGRGELDGAQEIHFPRCHADAGRDRLSRLCGTGIHTNQRSGRGAGRSCGSLRCIGSGS